MNHLVRVGVGDCLTHQREHHHEPPAVGGPVAFKCELVRERFALDELHRQERPPVRQCADLVNRGDARVLELSGDAGLIHEPARVGRVGRVAVLEELDRHVAIQGDITRPIHDAHPARTDLFQQFVTRRGDQLRRRERPPGPTGGPFAVARGHFRRVRIGGRIGGGVAVGRNAAGRGVGHAEAPTTTASYPPRPRQSRTIPRRGRDRALVFSPGGV